MESNLKAKILIVEDEVAILQGLIDVFVFHGFEVDSASDGQVGLDKALAGNYDLVLLDVMLPSIDGFTVCNKLKEEKRDQPVIMLTAKTTEEDIITGLSLGADDYVAKPFSVRELVLRVQAVLKRIPKFKNQNVPLEIGEDLKIDVLNLVGERTSGETVPFTRREIQILQYLDDRKDRPVSRDELLEEVWGYAKASNIETRTVDIHIAKLRRKIELDHKSPTLLVTVRGEGYRLMSTKEQ